MMQFLVSKGVTQLSFAELLGRRALFARALINSSADKNSWPTAAPVEQLERASRGKTAPGASQ